MQKNNEKKIKFLNNVEYILPKILSTNNLLKFDINLVDLKVYNNTYFINIYYNKLSLKEIKYIDYISLTEPNLYSNGFTILNDKTVYFCRFIIPEEYKPYTLKYMYNINDLSVKDLYNFYSVCL